MRRTAIKDKKEEEIPTRRHRRMDREGGGAAFCVFSVRSSFMLYRSFFPLLFSSLLFSVFV